MENKLNNISHNLCSGSLFIFSMWNKVLTIARSARNPSVPEPSVYHGFGAQHSTAQHIAPTDRRASDRGAHKANVRTDGNAIDGGYRASVSTAHPSPLSPQPLRQLPFSPCERSHCLAVVARATLYSWLWPDAILPMAAANVAINSTTTTTTTLAVFLPHAIPGRRRTTTQHYMFKRTLEPLELELKIPN